MKTFLKFFLCIIGGTIITSAIVLPIAFIRKHNEQHLLYTCNNLINKYNETNNTTIPLINSILTVKYSNNINNAVLVSKDKIKTGANKYHYLCYSYNLNKYEYYFTTTLKGVSSGSN